LSREFAYLLKDRSERAAISGISICRFAKHFSELMTLIRPTLDPAWKDYCVYSGRRLPEAALSDEHVIPKSLGGGPSTIIRASRALNSRFGTEIDGKVARDPLIQFGRRDAGARGQSGKATVPRWKHGHAGVLAMRSGARGRYNADIGGSGFPILFDTATGRHVPWGAHGDEALVFKLEIDHEARRRFVLKTLLGVGWRLFGPALLDSIDVETIRTQLGVEEDVANGALQVPFADPMLRPGDAAGEARLVAIERALIRPGATTIMMTQDSFLEWSVACCGHMVGVVSVPLLSRLAMEKTRFGPAVHLSVGRAGFSVQQLDPVLPVIT
jgi:hypothetical protein